METMTNDAGLARVRRTSRRWHVINELDVMRMVADLSQLEQMCAALQDGTDGTFQLSMRLRDLLDLTLIPQGRSEEAWLEDRLLDEDGPPLAQALVEAIRTGHCKLIHGFRRLARALEDTTEMPWELVHEVVDICRQTMMLKVLAVSYLAGHRLTPQARELLECSMITLQRGRVDA